MTARRLPPYARPIADARARGLIPRSLGGVHLTFTLDWRERRTGGAGRVVLPDDPGTYDLRFVAGLDVRVSFTEADAHRVPTAIDALFSAGARLVELVNLTLMDDKAPRERWLSVLTREAMRHAA
jgi:hypothetical protein